MMVIFGESLTVRINTIKKFIFRDKKRNMC